MVSDLAKVVSEEDIDPRVLDTPEAPATFDELKEVPLCPENTLLKLKVGKSLPVLEKEQLITLLHKHASAFAWSHSDMVGIDTAVIIHKLNIDPSLRPKVQK